MRVVSLFFNLQKCNLGSPEDFLSKALDPPQLQVISNAMNLLRKIGACELNEPKLTPLGQHLAALPVNVKIGKMLIFGAIFGCLDPVVSQMLLLLLHFRYYAAGKLVTLEIIFHSLKKVLFIYLSVYVKASIQWFILQLAATAQGWARPKPRASSESPT